MLKFFNTLTKEKEDFSPIKGKKVCMYNCGPTVYDDVHIGNLRSFVFADVLRRTLEFNGLKVKQILNITDIGHLSGDGDEGEDKMTRGLKREGKPITLKAMQELAEIYTKRFQNDLKELNIEKPTKMPRASSHIKEDVKLIKKLEQKGFTYKTSAGIYFDTSKDRNYGKLGGLSENHEAQIERNSEKRNGRDFALWKFSKSEGLGFKSPWGKGFPGWHIECSAMVLKYFSNFLDSFGVNLRIDQDQSAVIDIHTGGMDLIPIHHNNEIAQSENATGKHFARYWLHNEFVTMGTDKMAKSEGNVFKLQDLKEKGIDPLSFRYWLLTAHYRSPISFSWEAIEAAQTAFEKIKNQIQSIKNKGKISEKYLSQFKEAVNDDLNTPKAVAVLWEVLKDESLPAEDRKKTILEMDKVLGLGLTTLKKESVTIPSEVRSLVEKREKARTQKIWPEADRLRKEIEAKGFEVKDTEKGPVVKNL